MGDTWKDGRRAWERLDGWDDGSPARSGEAALRALADIGTVRRLLDQAELGAVKVARADRKSWAEIATRLGVTRQSAWERWRDLDEPEQSGSEDVPGTELDLAASALTGRAARRRAKLRKYPTVVPDVVGMSWEAARHMLQAKGLVATAIDPDGVPLLGSEQLRDLEPGGPADGPEGVVTDQSPESGAVVETGDTVTLWIGRGGGSAGVREPRRPRPTPLTEKESRPEPSEAVG